MMLNGEHLWRIALGIGSPSTCDRPGHVFLCQTNLVRSRCHCRIEILCGRSQIFGLAGHGDHTMHRASDSIRSISRVPFFRKPIFFDERDVENDVAQVTKMKRHGASRSTSLTQSGGSPPTIHARCPFSCGSITEGESKGEVRFVGKLMNGDEASAPYWDLSIAPSEFDKDLRLVTENDSTSLQTTLPRWVGETKGHQALTTLVMACTPRASRVHPLQGRCEDGVPTHFHGVGPHLPNVKLVATFWPPLHWV